MGGYYGAVSSKDVVADVFYGTDYHSHLGTRRGGMAFWDKEKGFKRDIHNIENGPFRTKFEGALDEYTGTAGLGCISDTDAQPLLIFSKLGRYAIAYTGAVQNQDELIEEALSKPGTHFEALKGGRVNSLEVIATLINSKSSFAEGLKFMQEKVEGSASVLILTERGTIIASRDKYGRTPIVIGRDDYGFSVSFESFAFQKMGYETYRELGPGEIVEIRSDGIKTLKEAGKEMKICGFLWTYYGYANSTYEGRNVELMRNRNGKLLAQFDEKNGKKFDYDYVCGVPDSGIAHAIGYANQSGNEYGRPFIKYTPTWPRSFMPTNQKERNHVASMKLVPVPELIRGNKLLFVDDSIVRGTQLKSTVEHVYEWGAREVHMRSACPPIMYGCPYLTFSRQHDSMELIARRKIYELEGDEGSNYIEEYSDGSTERGKKLREAICSELNFDSLEYQTVENTIKAIGLDRCKVCTYCWDGKK